VSTTLFISPRKYGKFKGFQYMAGGLDHHPQKGDHLYDSGSKFAPCHMLSGAASSDSPPVSDTISPWIFRV